jgi:RNA polymerase sigma factor (sigma-70 family)
VNERSALEAEPQGYVTEPAWDELVGRIRAGEASGMEDLYRVFSNGIRFYLYRQFGSQDLDDKVHDIFLTVTLAIRGGEVREPERLMGYVRTVVRRQVASYIERAMQLRLRQTGLDRGMPLSDRRPDPERSAIERQNTELAMRILNSVRKRDREVLIRFYLKEQTAPEICRDMDLSDTQFRLIKSRAKTRFGELGKSRLSLRTVVRRELCVS